MVKKWFRPRHRILFWVIGSVAIAACILVTSELSHSRLREANDKVIRSMARHETLTDLQGLLFDAESAERGYLLTGDRGYLEPYQRVLGTLTHTLDRMRDLNVGEVGGGKTRIELVRQIGEKLGEMNATIQLFEQSGTSQALDLVKTDLGKRSMERIRNLILELESQERARLKTGVDRWKRDLLASRVALGAMTALTIFFILLVFRQGLRELALEQENARLLGQNNERLESMVRARTAALSSLSSHLQNLQEKERANLARELHDELGSVLTAAKMDVAWVMSKLEADKPELAQKLKRTGDTLDEGVEIKRRLIEDLRPSSLEHLGLTAAVQQYVNETCKRYGLACKLDMLDDHGLNLSDQVKIALYRIIQESLTNLVRHSQAKSVHIALSHSQDALHLKVQDDGIGFVLEQALTNSKSQGIAGMRQRVLGLGGKFDIKTSAGTGARIEASIPLN